jgi:hypothetical protein
MPMTTAALDKIRRTRARALGVRDGIAQGAAFSSGITWTTGPWLAAGANDAYDYGVNVGQALDELRRVLRGESPSWWA